MANNILNLAMKVTADASGVVKSLTPAERALENLGKQAAKTTSVFDEFTKANDAAAATQTQFNEKFAALAEQLKGGLDATAYADQYAALQEEVRATAKAFEEGVAATLALRTEQEIHAQELERLSTLHQVGAIDAETYARGISEADAALKKATDAASKLSDETAKAAAQGLKFNEISGILSAIPGPLGSIAGRFSGLSSAAEGLNRVFSGGLSAGVRSVGASVGALVNPFTAGLAAVSAFGAGAVSISKSLIALEGETERLGQLADRLGVSFNFVQVLEASANQTGSSVEQLGGSFTKFLRVINEARNGTKSATEAFKALGVSTDDVRAGDPESLFTRTAAALSAMPDPAQRTATAMALFGKSGAELLPVLRQLGEASADLERIGGALTDQQRADLDAFGNAMDRVGVASTGLSRQVTASFATIGESIANSTAESIGSLNRLVKSLDDTASDTTFFGFEKTAARLRQDAALLEQRNAAIAETQKLASQNAIAAFVVSLQQSADGAVSLTGELEKAQSQAAEFGNSGSDAVLSLVKSLQDVAVAAEEAGYSEEQLAAAQKLAFADFGKRVELLKQQADAQLRATEATRRATEQEDEAATKAVESIRAQLNLAVVDSQRFGEAGFQAALKYQNAIAALEKQFDKRIINETVLKDRAAEVAAEFQKQADGFARIEELNRNIAAEEKQRLDQLLANANERTQVEKDLELVLRTQQQLQDTIQAARTAGRAIEADAAVSRLAQLDQQRTKLEEFQQAAEQGFGEGFKKSFEAIDQDINKVIERANEFGNAGAIAAQQLKDGIAAAQEQAKAGVLTKDTLDAEKTRLQDIFNQQLDNSKNVTKLILDGLTAEQQARLQFVEQEQAARLQAARNVAALELEIAATKAQIAQARDNGDLQEARIGVARLEQLNAIALREQDIAEGRRQTEAQIADQRVQQVESVRKAQEEYARQQQQAQQQYAQQQQKIFEEQQKAAAAEAARQEERLRKLNTLGEQSIQATDIRTVEGATLVTDLAASAQDPAMIQQRIQTKLLEKIAIGIGQAASNYFNQPVAIVGAARIGGIN
jgi:hypothetical protein